MAFKDLHTIREMFDQLSSEHEEKIDAVLLARAVHANATQDAARVTYRAKMFRAKEPNSVTVKRERRVLIVDSLGRVRAKRV